MKDALRQQIKQVLAAVAPDQAACKSLRACRSVVDLPEFADAEVVMIYLSIPGEVDTSHIALACWQQGKTVVVPKVAWSERRMVAVECQSIDEHMDVDKYGLRTPRRGQIRASGSLDMVIVPGLAFDRTGQRLGRGGGFYDRFLPELSEKARTVGLSFGEQVVDDLPVDAHDHPIDILVTDREVLRFTADPAT
jgi:5-formyltetrahydrofolate cyclo-ligase